MSKSRTRPVKSWTTHEKVSSACLLLSLLGNGYQERSTYKLQASNSSFEHRLRETELRLKQHENEPRLVQEYFVLPGNSYRAFATIDWTKATVANGGRPEFVETPLGAEIYDLIEPEHASRALKSIQVTFIAVRNDGKSVAQDVRLVTERVDQQVSLGNIHPGFMKLIPLQMVRSQPHLEKTESRRFTKCVYTDATADGDVQHELVVRPPSEVSWIPSLDALRGVGRALVTSDNEHLFK